MILNGQPVFPGGSSELFGHLFTGPAFNVPQKDFAEMRRNKQRVRQLCVGNLGCLAGAAQIAADEKIHRVVLKEILQSQSLILAFGIQGNVCVSLQAALMIPVGQPVTEEMNDFLHSGSIEALATHDGKGKNLNMNNIFRALRQSFEALLKIRMFLLIMGPPVVTVLGLLILFLVFWSTWTEGLAHLISHLWGYQWIQSVTGFTELAFWMAVLFLILVFLPLAYVLSVLIVSIFVMPVVLKWVGDGEYKHLEKRRGGSVVGSVWNTLKATAIFAVGFVITLPLWFVPGCQILVPVLLTAWLNKKVFLYDVLQDYASKEERRRIENEESAGLYGMGLLLGLLSYIPLAFFFVPIISALSYTYYGLNALEDRRR